MEIGLDQLIEAIKQLPTKQFLKLKTEINRTIPETSEKEDFQKFLLQAPIFSDEQIIKIKEARRNINKWGTK